MNKAPQPPSMDDNDDRAPERIDDGGPAFPIPGSCSPAGDLLNPDSWGMSLRDYLAAHAPITFADAVNSHKTDIEETFHQIFRRLAQMRLAYADAMIKVRKS